MQPHRWQPTRLRRPWDSPGKNTGVGCHFLLQSYPLLKPLFFLFFDLMSYYLHPGYTGLLAVPYNPQARSHLLFVLSLHHQVFIYMTGFLTSFRSLLKGNFTSEAFSDPFKKYFPHSIPYSCPSVPFPLSLLYFSSYYLLTSDTLCTCLFFVCHTQFGKMLLEGKNFVLFIL